MYISLYEELNEHNLGHIITDKKSLMNVLKVFYAANNEVIIFCQEDEKYKVYYKEKNKNETIILDNAVRIRFEGTYDEYQSIQYKIQDMLLCNGLVCKSNIYCKILQLDISKCFMVLDLYVLVCYNPYK